MALKYEVETLDGMDEATAAQYIKVGDVFRFDIEGVEDVTELKNAAKARKEERDALKIKLKGFENAANAAEAEKAEAERLRLVEKGEFKTLAEQAQAKELETAAKLEALETKIAEGERVKAALETTVGLTTDPARAEMLKEQALKYIRSTPEGVKIVGPAGDMDAAGLTAHLTTTLPFLVDGSQSGGGGSQGSGSGHQTGKTLGDYNDQELKALRTENKPEYDRVMKEGYK